MNAPATPLNYTYQTCVDNSERVTWKLDEVFPPDTVFDFSRAFLPDALMPTKGLSFLSEQSRRTLNQIGAKAYMNLFGYVEVFIEAMVLEHAQGALFGDRAQMRALTRFADEEVKHQLLFQRYCDTFDRDFATPCQVLNNAFDVAQVILSKSPLCVLLTTLHIEQMTQQHYIEAVRDEKTIDPLNAEILRCHWLEESQHAKIDALLLHELAASATAETLATAHAEYLDVLVAFDGLLAGQAGFDVESLAAATKASFTADERAAVVASQHKGYRKTFLHYGLTNNLVLQTITQFWSLQLAAHHARAESVIA